MQPIALFAWRLCSSRCPARDVLNPEECARADRIANEALRWRFICARAGLRKLLSGVVAQSPERLQLAFGPWGKPFAVEYTDIAFNMTHSEDFALLALGKVTDVGVDIERLRPLDDVLDLGKICLTLDELSWLRAIPLADQSHSFLRLWTRKEAVLKALGKGLSFPLTSFDVRPNGRDDTLVLSNLNFNISEVAVWRDTVASVAHPVGSLCSEVRHVMCTSGPVMLAEHLK